MVIDAPRYFEYVAREYVELLRRSAAESYADTAARLYDVLPDLWVRTYLLHCPFDTAICGFTHEPYEFLFDAIALQTGNTELEDRVVVAYGRSHERPDPERILEEMERALSSGESLLPAAEAFRFVLEHNGHALSLRRKDELGKAVASALGTELEPADATRDLLRRLVARPKPRLTMGILRRLREAVIPLLGPEPWPRMARASRQYSALPGMLGMDVGHFIAHAACGTADINTFPQETELNRGRSASGRKYRSMERYVAAKPGTFYFSRPVYSGPSWVPEYLEWGALIRLDEKDELPVIDSESGRSAVGNVTLLPAGSRFGWWIGVFQNRPSFRSELCSEDEFRRVNEIAEQVPSKLRKVLSTKLAVRRTRRARGIAAHYSGLEEVEERLSELGDFVKDLRSRLDKRVG